MKAKSRYQILVGCSLTPFSRNNLQAKKNFTSNPFILFHWTLKAIQSLKKLKISLLLKLSSVNFNKLIKSQKLIFNFLLNFELQTSIFPFSFPFYFSNDLFQTFNWIHKRGFIVLFPSKKSRAKAREVWKLSRLYLTDFESPFWREIQSLMLLFIWLMVKTKTL